MPHRTIPNGPAPCVLALMIHPGHSGYAALDGFGERAFGTTQLSRVPSERASILVRLLGRLARRTRPTRIVLGVPRAADPFAASLVADPGRKEAAAPVDASAFDPLIAWLNALEPGPGLSQTRDELLDEVRVAKRKALSNRRMSAQLVRELLPRLKGLPGAEPHVDRMAGFIEDA